MIDQGDYIEYAAPLTFVNIFVSVPALALVFGLSFIPRIRNGCSLLFRSDDVAAEMNRVTYQSNNKNRNTLQSIEKRTPILDVKFRGV